MSWSNEGPQLDPSQRLQFQGPYSGHTLSLSLCKKSFLQDRTGKKESYAIKQPWVTVKKSGFQNAWLGLFVARSFGKQEIVCIYYAPKKSKEPIEDK